MGGTPSHHPFSLDFQGYSDIPLLKKKTSSYRGTPMTMETRKCCQTAMVWDDSPFYRCDVAVRSSLSHPSMGPAGQKEQENPHVLSPWNRHETPPSLTNLAMENDT